jgi:hypothetical protein
MNPFDSLAQQALSTWKQLVDVGFDAAAKVLQEQHAYVLRVADIVTQTAPTKA